MAAATRKNIYELKKRANSYYETARGPIKPNHALRFEQAADKTMHEAHVLSNALKEKRLNANLSRQQFRIRKKR